MPIVGQATYNILSKARDSAKHLFLHGAMFEELGFRLVFSLPALFRASYASPPVMEPSPITAITCSLPPNKSRAFATLCKELRRFLLRSVSKTGGHLASNLGVVELTVALEYCFNLPEDKIVWDVGHQAYIHKILTGRKEQLSRNCLKCSFSF